MFIIQKLDEHSFNCQLVRNGKNNFKFSVFSSPDYEIFTGQMSAFLRSVPSPVQGTSQRILENENEK